MRLLDRDVQLIVSSCAFLALIQASCSRAPGISETEFSTERPSTPASKPIAVAESSLYGISVAITNACSDEYRTVVQMLAELDPAVWGLSREDFPPLGNVYFDTSTVLLEDGQAFSGIAGGARHGPWFDEEDQLAKVSSTLIHPEPASAASAFELIAEVTLLNLPDEYRPPLGLGRIDIVEIGVIVIPVQFQLPVTMASCQ